MSQAIKGILDASMRDGVIHGAAVVAGDNKQVLYRHSQGLAVAAANIPMTTRSIIDVASVGKVVSTATSLAICRDRGLIDFDAPFTDYLPEYHAELFAPVTVRDLAMHISGFGHHPGKPRQYDAPSGPEIMAKILAFPPLYPSGQHFEYACWNFLLLGRIVEKVSGQTLKDFAEKEIFAPLGMKDSSVNKPYCQDPQRLSQTQNTDAPGQVDDFILKKIVRDGGCGGNGGVFTTAEDLVIFCQCMLNGGRYDEGRQALISPSSFAELSTNRMPAADMPKRGFCWVIADQYKPANSSDRLIYHSGWTGQTIFADLAKQRFVVILTTRCGDYDRAKQERSDLADLLFAGMLD